MDYIKGKQLYEGKAKKVFETNDPQVYIVAFDILRIFTQIAFGI